MAVTIANGQILANLVILSRASEKQKTALLIEGDKDGRIYRKVVDLQRCRLFPAGNRAIAEEALRLLKKANQKGVLAIVDADVDHITNTKSPDPDLLLTHTRDAEGILLDSGALASVLIEFDIPAAFGPSPERVVVDAVVPLAYAKFIAEKNKWTVKISQIDFQVFIDPRTLTCDTAALCKHMADLTLTMGITAEHYQAELHVLMAAGVNPLTIARGHDATSLLAWAVPLATGKKRKDGALIESRTIESYLRTAYTRDAFSKCELRKKIEEWEKQNAPYKVLQL